MTSKKWTIRTFAIGLALTALYASSTNLLLTVHINSVCHHNHSGGSDSPCHDSDKCPICQNLMFVAKTCHIEPQLHLPSYETVNFVTVSPETVFVSTLTPDAFRCRPPPIAA